jgi:putative hydrolase of the HAD superfamily
MNTDAPPPSSSKFEHPDVWVFDLDNTLYPARHQLFQQIDVNMKTFIAELLGVDREEAHRIQKDFFHTYGTTLRGLMNAHSIEPGPFLDFVHDIDLSNLPPSPQMNQALGALNGRKIVFTNASLDYAERVLEQLQIRHHFEDVFDIIAADYLPKPDINAYYKLINVYGIDPKRTAMFEDISANLAPARALGMTTVWVPRDPEAAQLTGPDDHVDHVVEDLAHWLHVLSLTST